MHRPNSQEHPAYFAKYIQYTQGETISSLIQHHAQEILDYVHQIPAAKADYAYAEGKWTIKQVLQHMIDTERVFVYRAMRFSRNDATDLAGFDENNYALHAGTATRTLESLQTEFELLRKSTDVFLQTLTEEQLSRGGKANDKYATVNALAYIIFGHALHHIAIIKERYS